MSGKAFPHSASISIAPFQGWEKLFSIQMMHKIARTSIGLCRGSTGGTEKARKSGLFGRAPV
jgi:hypothetical protein